MRDHILLFLGSGVSIPSDMPSVKELTRRLLQDSYHRTTVENYYPGDDHNPHFRELHSARPIQEVLHFLAEYASSFLNRIHEPEVIVDPNYEDLYYLCDQIHDDILATSLNPAVHEFTRLVEVSAKEIILSHPDENKRSLLDFVREARLLIPSVVWHALDRRYVEPKGLDLVHCLAGQERLDQLSVVTLNHDTLVERVLRKYGTSFEDGFGDVSGSVRWYEPDRLFHPDTKVRLLKPHGSVDWYRYRRSRSGEGPSGAQRLDRYGMHVGDDVYHSADAEGDSLLDLNTVPLFLSGTGKELLYNSGIYGDMYDAFLQALREVDTVVMSGFGWNDGALCGRFYTWLDRSDKHKILILHESPQDLIWKTRCGWGLRKYFGRGQVIANKTWLANTSLSEVFDALGIT